MEIDQLIKTIKKHRVDHAKGFARAKAENETALERLTVICKHLSEAGIISHFTLASARVATLTAYLDATELGSIEVSTSIEDGERRFHIKVSPDQCPVQDYIRNDEHEAAAAFISAVEREGGYALFVDTLGPGDD